MPIAIKALAAAILAAVAALPIHAQHTHHSPAAASPYAGRQARDIKALSDQEVKDLLEGAGMGFAKAAELNRHPGPSHALEHAAALELTGAQQKALKELLDRHKAEARALGAVVVEGERELDALFASRSATADGVDRILARLADASARLRGSHLNTHLATTALLTPAQIGRYVELRGYASAASSGHRH